MVLFGLNSPNIPIHDIWPSGRIVCPSIGSGKFRIFVLVRLIRCTNRRTSFFVRLNTFEWLTSLYVHKFPLWLSSITSSVLLLVLSKFSLWCGSSEAFSSYSEVVLLNYLSNAISSFSWAQIGGDTGDVSPHFFRQGDRIWLVPILFSLYALYLERFPK